jgi:hypothetical protein
LRKQITAFRNAKLSDADQPTGSSPQERLRNALLSSGLHSQYTRWIGEVHAAICAKFGAHELDEIEVVDWIKLLSPQREDMPAPVHTLILCCFLETTPEHLLTGYASVCAP